MVIVYVVWIEVEDVERSKVVTACRYGFHSWMSRQQGLGALGPIGSQHTTLETMTFEYCVFCLRK